MVFDHDHEEYRRNWRQMTQANRYNGAFYYSKEIVKNIIPNVKTDRDWLTVKVGELASDGAIVFIHNNLHPDRYDYLKRYKDLVLVCGVPETCKKVEHLGTAIYLPLSIDVEYVKQFAVDKSKRHGSCYIGRPAKRRYTNVKLPEEIDIIEGVKRQNMLPMMARYEYVYAVGRTAIEAKALGCKLKAFDKRFPKVSLWKVIDNRKAAQMLQAELDKIDG